MKLHLIDGTYELFRNYFGAPSARNKDGVEVGATRGLCRTLLSLVTKEGATHVACAFDRVIESFRNQLFPGYKTGAGMPPELWAQFPLAERAAHALGMVVWPMTDFEADDALASAAERFLQDGVEQILLCSPDKDLAQCVQGKRVVCLDRRRQILLDEEGVIAKFGVPPRSIPDFLALVGDSADGIPGIPRWGEKAASALLRHYVHLDRIPSQAADWEVKVRGAEALAEQLRTHLKEALLYRQLATLRRDAALHENLSDLEWKGARRKELETLCEEIGETRLIERVPRWRSA